MRANAFKMPETYNLKLTRWFNQPRKNKAFAGHITGGDENAESGKPG